MAHISTLADVITIRDSARKALSHTQKVRRTSDPEIYIQDFQEQINDTPTQIAAKLKNSPETRGFTIELLEEWDYTLHRTEVRWKEHVLEGIDRLRKGGFQVDPEAVFDPGSDTTWCKLRISGW